MKKRKFTIALALLMSVCLLFTACGGGAGGDPTQGAGGGLDSTPKTYTLTAAELPQKVDDICKAIRDKEWAADISITLVITDEAPDFAAIGDALPYTRFSSDSNITLDLSRCTGVSKVKEGDFNSTVFRTLILPEGITEIEYDAFTFSKVRSIYIPSTLTNFESMLLVSLDCLEEVNFAEENPCYCSIDGIVYTKNKHKLVFIPTEFPGTTITLPKELSEIEGFYLTIPPFTTLKKLETIVVEQGCTTYATANGALLNADKTELLIIPTKRTSFEIPATVTSINEYCISKAKSLETISVEDGNVSYSAVDNLLLNAAGTTLVAVPSTRKTVEVPSTVTEIGTDCFWWCTELETVTLPEGLQTIGNAVFVGCKNLTELTIPSTVTKIGYMFLDACAKCKTLILKPVTPPAMTVGSDPFLQDTTGFTIKVPSESVDDYQEWALTHKSNPFGSDAQKWQQIHDAITAM